MLVRTSSYEFAVWQAEAKALGQHNTNIEELAKGKGGKQGYGPYLGSFHAAAEAVASKFHAVEGTLRWDALR